MSNTLPTVADLRRILADLPDTTRVRIINLDTELHCTLVTSRYFDKDGIQEFAEQDDCSVDDVKMTMENDGVEEYDLVLYIDTNS